MFKKLLLAVDINDPKGMMRTTQAAVDMTRANESKLHILNVVPSIGMPIVGASLEQNHSKQMLETARAELEVWSANNIAPDIDLTLHVTVGTVYDQIIKQADASEIDAIFVGAHSPELKDYLIGPNAARVARHAKQSVFVIR